MKQMPFVTVIMPIRNEAKYIEQSLGAVLAQDYPADRMEVILADGMSDDGTRTIIENLTRQRSASNGETANVKVIDNPERIVASGLNRALAVARSEIIVRVDGHCEIATDYVRKCVEYLQQNGVDGVGGPIETVAQSFAARAIAAAMNFPFGVGDSTFRIGTTVPRVVDTVPFPAYRREMIEVAGAYDEEQVRNQDDEYNYRLRKLGARLLLAPDVRAKYYSRATLRSLWKQYFQYGFWKVRVMQKHPRQMRWRQFVPAAFVSALAGSLAAGGFTEIGWMPFGGILGSYVLANLAASAFAAKKRWQLFPLLPLAFATLHVSYGLGFIVGLVHFAGKWGVPGNVPPLRMRAKSEILEPAEARQ